MHIWLKQDYETDRDFCKFNIFLNLPMRTVRKAYHEWAITVQKELPEEVLRKNPQNYWYNLSRGSNYYTGEDIEGSYTWQERCEAYDKFIGLTDVEAMKAKREGIINAEYRHYKKMVSDWEAAYNELEDNKELDQKSYLTQKFELIKMRKTISEMGRTALGMPSSIKQDNYGNADERPFEIIWHEVEPDSETVKQFERHLSEAIT